MQFEDMVSISAGPSQLIAALCDEIGLEDIINRSLTWEPTYCKVSPGTHVKAMIINILCSRMPLYRIAVFYATQDTEQLFGAGCEAAVFNDDALGRMLDRLFEAQSWKVYSELSLAVLRTLGLPLDRLHADTTSFSLQGDRVCCKPTKGKPQPSGKLIHAESRDYVYYVLSLLTIVMSVNSIRNRRAMHL
ncbi:DUF4277 domain-containing protein [Paenibacillus shunpengii]|uniref:DUF4277 domain-containing protein n=1 Tax=Paenibacillus shunpengii TaxID=2054424 RepID=A0ABW5SLW1_9BACL